MGIFWVSSCMGIILSDETVDWKYTFSEKFFNLVKNFQLTPYFIISAYATEKPEEISDRF